MRSAGRSVRTAAEAHARRRRADRICEIAQHQTAAGLRFTFSPSGSGATRFLDFAFSNTLEIIDGKLTGRTHRRICDAQAKARHHNQKRGDALGHHQTLAIGDRANDLPMMAVAGFSIAFPPNQQAEAAWPSFSELDALPLFRHTHCDVCVGARCTPLVPGSVRTTQSTQNRTTGAAFLEVSCQRPRQRWDFDPSFQQTYLLFCLGNGKYA